MSLDFPIFFSFNHFQIFLDEYGTNLVTSVVLVSRHTRRCTRLGSPVVVSCRSIFKPSPAKPCRIRTSENPRLQLLWNPRFQERFLSADSKRLILAEQRPQPVCNQHLRTPPGSAENTGLITLLESALTKNAPATPLESALPKNRGEGGRNVKRRSSNISSQPSAFKRANVSTVHSHAPCALPLRPAILDEYPMQLFTSHEPPACPERSRGVTDHEPARRGGSRVIKYV
jgi:hypothetical protein